MFKNDLYCDSLRAIPIGDLVSAIGGAPKGKQQAGYYRTPLGKLQVTPGIGGDSYHFWSGSLAGTAGHGAISFVQHVGLASNFGGACDWLETHQGRNMQGPPRPTTQPLVTRAQKPYQPPWRVFDDRLKASALIGYLTGQRGIPSDIVLDLLRQPHGPLAAGYGPRYGHYILFPMRNHTDPKKPEVGAILRWKGADQPPKTLFGGEKAPKAPGTQTGRGWWQVGPYPASTVIVTEAPIDALSLWAALMPADRETTRIVATGGEGGLSAPGLWAGTERVYLAQDRDQAGGKQALKTWIAAYAASTRCPTTRLLPPGSAKDWNAAWQADPNAVRTALATALQPAQAQSQARSR